MANQRSTRNSTRSSRASNSLSQPGLGSTAPNAAAVRPRNRPARGTVDPPTTEELNNAIRQCPKVINSYSDLPANKRKFRYPLFAAQPPSHLSREEEAMYNDAYKRLIKALNVPPGTTRGMGADKRSRARSTLWKLWFDSYDRHQGGGNLGENSDSEEEESLGGPVNEFAEEGDAGAEPDDMVMEQDDLPYPGEDEDMIPGDENMFGQEDAIDDNLAEGVEDRDVRRAQATILGALADHQVYNSEDTSRKILRMAAALGGAQNQR